jgi:hypothetical protein
LLERAHPFSGLLELYNSKRERPEGRPGELLQIFLLLFNNLFDMNGGEGGIRTLGTLVAYTHFPGVLLRPLGHLSRDCMHGACKGSED